MVIEPAWLDDKQTILSLEFPERCTMAEYESATRRANEMIMARQEPVIVMLQFADNQHLPKGFFARAYKLHLRMPPNQIASVVIGTSPFVRSTFSILQRVFSRRNASIRLVDSMDDALALCNKPYEMQ